METPRVHIDIFDTTLRDGAQSLPEHNQFTEGAKPEIAHTIANLGVSVIEAGFPATPFDAEEVQTVAQTVGKTNFKVRQWNSVDTEHKWSIERPPIIAGLSRTVPSDIEATWQAIQYAENPRIHTFISTDSEHMAAKFPGKSADEVMEMGRMAVTIAKEISQAHNGATVEFSAEAASTTDAHYLEKVIKSAIDAGADVVNVPDTVGQRDPNFMENFYSRVIRWVLETNPYVVISAHNHNDLGVAAINSYSLVKAAAALALQFNRPIHTQIETTIAGLGERAGNADIFTLVGQLDKFSVNLAVPVEWEFNPELSVATARQVLAAAGLDVNRQAPIVGKDTNVHRSGIHSDGVIKGGYEIYTPHNPKFWGHKAEAVHEEGKYQGKKGRAAAKQSNSVQELLTD